MSSVAHVERTLLCAVAQQVGPDAPTLCEGWDVRDLVVHLLVREGSLSSIGIVVKPLSGWMDRTSERLGRRDFDDLVKRLRHGPPRWSLFAVPKLGELLNALEYFVHHEDIRRAQPGWEPRSLPVKVEDAIWKATRHAGKGLVARSPVGVVAERSDTGERVTFKNGDREVVVRGLPSEVTLFVFGRKEHARVDLEGASEDTSALVETSFGV
jgi:uncharacterized protein (TIGR03085 family)